MPIEVGIWKINNGVSRIKFTPIESEQKLEEILEEDISIISEDLLLLGRQIPTEYGKYIDLLAIDPEGNLVLIELKKKKTPRDVVAQVLDYASWIQKLSYDKIVSIYEDNYGGTLEEAFDEQFGVGLPDELNNSHQMIIVSAQLDNETERIINYLSNNFGVPINALFFRYFRDGKQEYISRSWLLDPEVVEEKSATSISEKKKEKWNQRDFVVNFADETYRSWNDARRYGFISAGNGKWYSQTLHSLFLGARIFCMIPGRGYVGIGEVISKAVPLRDAEVVVDGVNKKLIDCDLELDNIKHDLDDLVNCEYVVGVKWIKTIPRDQAFWTKGLRANQNSAYKLRSQFTIDKVLGHFELLED